MIIGFSTGIFYTFINDRMNAEVIDNFLAVGCNALEIMTRIDDLHLEKLKNDQLEQFDHVSLHAPCEFDYDYNDETKYSLEVIAQAHEKFHFKNIVIHPDRIKNPSVFHAYKLPFAVENIDNRKNFGRSVADLQQLLTKLPHFNFVLDLNHCFVNDSTLILAKDLYETFKEKLVEIHISGYKTMHDPLYETQQKEIVQAIPDANIPIIIESCFNDKDHLKDELKYIKKYI